jgi:hypothetical protein
VDGSTDADPQQATVPSVFTPQVWYWYALIKAKLPAGGVAITAGGHARAWAIRYSRPIRGLAHGGTLWIACHLPFVATFPWLR